MKKEIRVGSYVRSTCVNLKIGFDYLKVHTINQEVALVYNRYGRLFEVPLNMVEEEVFQNDPLENVFSKSEPISMPEGGLYKDWINRVY